MPSAKVLIVEDEGVTALSFRGLLLDAGYEVVAVETTGEAAVKQAGELGPDIILMDVHLAGGMDGIEAADLIHRQYHIPFIFVSAYLDAETLKRAKDTHPFAYLHKPVESTTLLTTIEIVLNKHEGVNANTVALEETSRLLNAFQRIAGSMLASIDLDKILDTLAEQVVHAGIFRSLMVALVDEESHSVEIVRAVTRVGAKGELRSPHVNIESLGRRMDLFDDDLTCETARHGTLTVIEGTDSRFDREGYAPHRREGQVFYFIPVIREGSVIAILATGSHVDDRPEILRRLEMMQPLLGQVAIALDHARLYRTSQEHIAQIEQINANLRHEISERERAENALRQEHLLREAEVAVRLRVASLDQPHDLFGIVKEISYQLQQVGVIHDHCSLQVINRDRDDFVCLTKDNAKPRSRAWSKITNTSWPRDSSNGEDFPWVIDVWRGQVARYEPCNPSGNRLPVGISVIDVPFSQGTLAISRGTSFAFSDRDVEIVERFGDVVSAAFQRLEDLVARLGVEPDGTMLRRDR